MLQLIQQLPQKWQQAVLGALLGDALGVPHEFKDGRHLPDSRAIQMVMPEDYRKTYEAVPYGTWSDDGSQLLALLDVFLREQGRYSADRFREHLLAWLHDGCYQAGGQVFDVGAQTRAALRSLASNEPVFYDPDRCGNGSLMRVLPVAALPELFGTSRTQALRVAIMQSQVTHPQPIAAVACALYVQLAWLMDECPAAPVADLVALAAIELRANGELSAQEDSALAYLMEYGAKELPTGAGYAPNSLWSAVWAVSAGDSLSSILRKAISLGNDTDTIACLAGGLAAMRHGLDAQSQRWLAQMTFKATKP